MLNRQQLNILKRYREAADLSDFEFRCLLYQLTGANDPGAALLTNRNFDDVIVELETELFRRVDAGKIPPPRGIRRAYWAGRLPAAGLVDRRQAHEIERQFGHLMELLPPDHPAVLDPKAYALGMARQAVNRPDLARLTDLRKHDAALLFEAIKDRTAHAEAALSKSKLANPETEL